MATIDLQALADELRLDPEGLGYDTADPKQCYALLNTRNQPTLLFRRNVPMWEVLGEIDWINDVAGVPDRQFQVLMLLLNQDQIDVHSTYVRDALGTILSGTASLTRLQALLQRQASRGEILFGQNVAVPLNPIISAIALI